MILISNKKWIYTIALTTCALLLLFNFSERTGVVRRLQDESELTCTSRDSIVGYRKRANCVEFESFNGQRVEMKYNEWGLRDKPFKIIENEFRILLLGSSYLTAPGIPANNIPARILERELNKLKLGMRTRVVNAGIPGYGAIQNAIFIEEYIKIFRPHIVLYHLTPKNEIFADAVKISDVKWLGDKPLEITFKPLIPMPSSFYRASDWRRSILKINFLMRKQLDYFLLSWRVHPPISRPEKVADRFMSATIRLMRYMQAEAGKHNIPFAAIWIENSGDADQNVLRDIDYQIVDVFQRYFIRSVNVQARLITRILESEKISFIPLWDERLIDPSLRMQDGLHWNQLTATLFAKLLASEMATRKWLWEK